MYCPFHSIPLQVRVWWEIAIVVISQMWNKEEVPLSLLLLFLLRAELRERISGEARGWRQLLTNESVVVSLSPLVLAQQQYPPPPPLFFFSSKQLLLVYSNGIFILWKIIGRSWGVGRMLRDVSTLLLLLWASAMGKTTKGLPSSGGVCAVCVKSWRGGGGGGRVLT